LNILAIISRDLEKGSKQPFCPSGKGTNAQGNPKDREAVEKEGVAASEDNFFSFTS
jgi:hypothetical protein